MVIKNSDFLAVFLPTARRANLYWPSFFLAIECLCWKRNTYYLNCFHCFHIFWNFYDKTSPSFMYKNKRVVRANSFMWWMPGSKLRLTGRKCDQKLSVGDQNLFKTGCWKATNLLSPWHLKYQGKRTFSKENIELSWTTVVKRSDNFKITTFTRRHIV